MFSPWFQVILLHVWHAEVLFGRLDELLSQFFVEGWILSVDTGVLGYEVAILELVALDSTEPIKILLQAAFV